MQTYPFSPAMKATISQWGNSLALRIPKGIAEELGLLGGTTVDLHVEDDTLHIAKMESKEDRLEKLITRISPENRHDLVDWGPAQGKEVDL